MIIAYHGTSIFNLLVANSLLQFLYWMKATSTETATLIGYHSLFESHFPYGLVLWSDSSSNNLQKVMVLRRVVRQAYKIPNIITVTAVYIHGTILYAPGQSLNRFRWFRQLLNKKWREFQLTGAQDGTICEQILILCARLFNQLPLQHKKRDPKYLKRQLRKLSTYGLHIILRYLDVILISRRAFFVMKNDTLS